VYRYFHGGHKDHFYTTELHEIGTAQHGATGNHGYQSEGTGFHVRATPIPGFTAVYRYFTLETMTTSTPPTLEKLEQLNLAPLATTGTNSKVFLDSSLLALLLVSYLFTDTSTVATRTTSTPPTLEKLVPLNTARLATTATNLKEFWATPTRKLASHHLLLSGTTFLK
jgi:hypothetical protein